MELTGNVGAGSEVAASARTEEQRDGAGSGGVPGQVNSLASSAHEATIGKLEGVVGGGSEGQQGRGQQGESETHLDDCVEGRWQDWYVKCAKSDRRGEGKTR